MTGGPFSVERRRRDGKTRVIVAGEVDLLTAPRVVEDVQEAVTEPDVAAVVVDLVRVSFVDSSGLRALLQARAVAESSGVSFTLAIDRGPVESLLSLAGVTDWFDYD